MSNKLEEFLMYKPKDIETERWVNCKLRLVDLPELHPNDMVFSVKKTTRYAGSLAFDAVDFYIGDQFLFWCNLPAFEYSWRRYETRKRRIR